MQTATYPERKIETWDPVAAAEADDENDDWLLLDDAEEELLAELLAAVDDSVDEIVDSVLDAADVEILEDLGGGPVGAAGPEGEVARADARDGVLLRRLLNDLLRRYLARQRLKGAPGRAA